LPHIHGRSNPSRSFTLRHLGSRLPESSAKHITDPVLRRRAVAVAEIECALMAVFEAADANPASPERIAGGTPITLHPALILLAQYANASEWLHDETVPWLEEGDAPFHRVVWRTETHAQRHATIPSGAFRMLERLRGNPMTMHHWLAEYGDDITDPASLTRWFSEWRERGWLVPHEP
jgi:hypothetical protein